MDRDHPFCPGLPGQSPCLGRGQVAFVPGPGPIFVEKGRVNKQLIIDYWARSYENTALCHIFMLRGARVGVWVTTLK